MTRRLRIGVTLLALVVSGALGAAQERPNFAGIWKSDNATNPAVRQSLVTNDDLEIRQNETAIGIIQGKRESAYELDGSPSRNPNGVSTVSWDGKRLVINEPGGWRRILSIVGSDLTVEYFYPRNSGSEPDIRMLYRKAP